MSATEIVREPEQTSVGAVRLLYVCDWPPSNLGGGPILMSRLLCKYPGDAITVLTSTRFVRVSPRQGRLSCDEIAVPVSEGHGRFGLGRMRAAANWIRIPLIAAAVRRAIRRRKVAAILTVLHGQFYFAAALAARLTRLPYVVIVHDDYISGMSVIVRKMTQAVMRKAAHIYCVSPEMQAAIRTQFGVESELQRPGTECPSVEPPRAVDDELSIVYAGSVTAAVEDSVRALAGLITGGLLKAQGIAKAKLHLYTLVKEDQKRAWGWDHPDVVIHAWVGQEELPQVLRRADILFLPFSFAPEERHTVETAFPSKTADYLAAGRPILVFGPDYSSLVGYARREGFGEIVAQPSPELLATAIARIALDPRHREILTSRALALFSKNHDIRQQRVQFLHMLDTIVGNGSGKRMRPAI